MNFHAAAKRAERIETMYSAASSMLQTCSEIEILLGQSSPRVRDEFTYGFDLIRRVNDEMAVILAHVEDIPEDDRPGIKEWCRSAHVLSMQYGQVLNGALV